MTTNDRERTPVDAVKVARCTMSPKDQIDALTRACSLIFSVEQARRAGDACDKQIAHVCYLARVELGKVDSECRIELGYRERKWFNSIVPGRKPSPDQENAK